MTLTATAQDVERRGCRRGTPRDQQVLARAPGHRTASDDATYRGERHQLVVLAAFSDLDFEDGEQQALQKWDKVFNAVNYREGSYQGSVHDYYYDQSYGQFSLTFDLIYLRLDQPRARYASTKKDDENSQYLVNDIVDILEHYTIDWSLYDWRGYELVNQLVIIYAGRGMNDGGDQYTIWPHQWWLSQHLKDRQPGVYCEPRTVTSAVDGKEYTIDCYCATQELGGRYAPFGTICHEYTHCFAFPDFYYSTTKYVGDWDLLDNGNFNGQGYCPPGFSAHERWLMGWMPLQELTGPETITQMPPLSDEPCAFIVRNDGYEEEYYIVENRQQRGWDKHVPGNGLVVFHIDYDAGIWKSADLFPNHPTYTDDDGIVHPAEKRYTIIPANNSTSPYLADGWPYPYYNNDQLTNTSRPVAELYHPNTDGTLLMNKPLTDISMDDDGRVSFLFMGGATAIETPHSSDHSTQPSDGCERTLYNLGPVSIVRHSDGTVRKVIKRR